MQLSQSYGQDCSSVPTTAFGSKPSHHMRVDVAGIDRDLSEQDGFVYVHDPYSFDGMHCIPTPTSKPSTPPYVPIVTSNPAPHIPVNLSLSSLGTAAQLSVIGSPPEPCCSPCTNASRGFGFGVSASGSESHLRPMAPEALFPTSDSFPRSASTFSSFSANFGPAVMNAMSGENVCTTADALFEALTKPNHQHPTTPSSLAATSFCNNHLDRKVTVAHQQPTSPPIMAMQPAHSASNLARTPKSNNSVSPVSSSASASNAGVSPFPVAFVSLPNRPFPMRNNSTGFSYSNHQQQPAHPRPNLNGVVVPRAASASLPEVRLIPKPAGRTGSLLASPHSTSPSAPMPQSRTSPSSLANLNQSSGNADMFNNTNPNAPDLMMEVSLAERFLRFGDGASCAHVESWRRLRWKKGINQLLCSKCGAKWRSPKESPQLS